MQRSHAASHHFHFIPSIRVFCVLLLLATVSVLSAYANGVVQTTITTLDVPFPIVTAGTPVTLTATVTGLLVPVTAGEVVFCDALLTLCQDSAVIGTAQITSDQTAVIRLVPGVGIHSYNAVFQGTNGADASESLPVLVTVTGNASYPSTTTIDAGGVVDDYTLTSTVEFFGTAPATGTVAFVDTSAGNISVGTALLDPTTLELAMVSAAGSPATGAGTQGSAVGDFNQDGVPDLAVTNTADNTVSVLLGNGDGTFQTQVAYPVGIGPMGIAIGDPNGDGISDLVVVNAFDGSQPGTVSVLLGTGDGTFLPQTLFDTGIAPAEVALGDFNNDGNADIAITNTSDNTLSVLLGNGDGAFQTQVLYPVGQGPIGVVAGDINADGTPDLIVANDGDGEVGVLLGNGDGTFQSEAVYAVGNGALAVALGDFNGDGAPDLAVTEAGGVAHLLLGNGDGTFQAEVPYSVGADPKTLAVGDFDGDGLSDLIVANETDSTVSVLLGNGDGTLQPQVTYQVGEGPVSVTVADFNGDGVLDIETANSVTNDATVLLGAHTETATAVGIAVPGTGTKLVDAVYPGDTSRAGSESNTVPLIGSGVVLTATTTGLTVSPNPAVSGETVTLTATVSPVPAGSPAGTASFYSGSTLLGTADVNSSGVATFATTSLQTGTNTITAVYSGNADSATSTSSGVDVTVNTTFTVTGPPAPFTVNAGDAVDIEINVPPIGGSFDSVVTMSATGLPPGDTATFHPPTVIPGASGAVTVMTVQTAPRTAGLPRHQPQFPFAPISLAAGLCVMANQRKRLGKSVAMLVLIASLAGGTLMLTGCNGGFAGPSPRSLVITVTGTSGARQVSTTVTLFVK